MIETFPEELEEVERELRELTKRVQKNRETLENVVKEVASIEIDMKKLANQKK